MKRNLHNNKYLYLLLIIVFLIVNCNKYLPSDRFRIENSDISRIEKEALSGSSDAAFKLYQYYEFWVEDDEKSTYWLKIAAEYNHPIAQYNLAYSLINDPNPNNRLQGLFLANKLVQKGHKDAIELITYYKKIEKMRSKKK